MNNATHTANSATTIPSGRARPTEMPGAGDSAENRDADSSSQLNRGGGRLGEAECTNKQAPRKGNRSSGLGFVTPSGAHRAPPIQGPEPPARPRPPPIPSAAQSARPGAGGKHSPRRAGRADDPPAAGWRRGTCSRRGSLPARILVRPRAAPGAGSARLAAPRNCSVSTKTLR